MLFFLIEEIFLNYLIIWKKSDIVYEVILNKKLLDPAFRRIIADKVVKSEKMRTGGGHRPSVLFKYKR